MKDELAKVITLPESNSIQFNEANRRVWWAEVKVSDYVCIITDQQSYLFIPVTDLALARNRAGVSLLVVEMLFVNFVSVLGI